PQALPVRTTCGTISSPTTGSDRSTFLRAHRWRYPWLKESLVAHRGRRAVRGGPFLLSDIRRDIDDALAGRTDPLKVVNLLDAQEAFPADEDELTLLRRGQPIEPSFVPRAQLPALLADWRPDRSLLVTNLQLADFRTVAAAVGSEHRLAGYHEGIGHWQQAQLLPLGPGSAGTVSGLGLHQPDQPVQRAVGLRCRPGVRQHRQRIRQCVQLIHAGPPAVPQMAGQDCRPGLL